MIFLIVDDEANARNLLKNFLLELNIPAQNIITAADIKSAVKIINNQPIDLVLLDIEMPQENGFALFDYFKNPTFKTIFCTAYSEYALKAFEVSAVDYLLKPISLKKLEEAIKKINNYKPINQTETSVLKENLEEKSFKKIGIQLGDSLVFFKIEDIYYFEADGSYTLIHHKDGKDLATKKIKHFEDVLGENSSFFRMHRSYMINIAHLTKYTRREGPAAIMANGALLPVSRERKTDFEDFINLNNSI